MPTPRYDYNPESLDSNKFLLINIFDRLNKFLIMMLFLWHENIEHIKEGNANHKYVRIALAEELNKDETNRKSSWSLHNATKIVIDPVVF